MKRIVMLAFEDAQILDITGPLQILGSPNRGRSVPRYEIVLAAPKAGPFRTTEGLSLVATAAWSDPGLLRGVDTLMVAGGEGLDRVRKDKTLRALVRRGARQARRVVSVCTGAFALAEAGILDGKRATTHWSRIEQFRREFPNVALEPDAIFVRDGKIWTSAGVTAGMDLALALLREDLGDEVALAVARQHVIFVMRPGGQSQFSAHLKPEAYPKGKLSGLLRWIPEHAGEDIDVAALAAKANMSERSFARIFVRETGETPARYLERTRIDAARRLLTASDLPIATVALRAGFGNEERMRRAFQRQLKTSPGAFRARFQPAGVSP
ncbi:MAG: GlxA family transcriptional regulator [Proteobacteria bacterium]|nr:GlxA family transcriptional regulator [Pseudomonadota bacterium]